MLASVSVIDKRYTNSANAGSEKTRVPVINALASEAVWTLKIVHDRKTEEADHATSGNLLRALPLLLTACPRGAAPLQK
jgi:hypothetical protein